MKLSGLLAITFLAGSIVAVPVARAEDGILTVVTEPGGAKISINGTYRGTSPEQKGQSVDIHLAEGEYTVTAVKEIEDSLRIKRATKTEVFVGERCRQPLFLRLSPQEIPNIRYKNLAESGTFSDNGMVFTNFIGMKFVRIKGGCFQMGNTFDDVGFNEKPVHRVCVDDFYLGAYEVTQKEYQKITGENPSKFKNGDSLPVENVSWDDIQKYIYKLYQRDGLHYSLPTEAQWEYAAREGGRKVRFGNGKNVADPGEINFDCRGEYKKSYSRVGVFRNRTTFVGLFSPNSLGLYDMSGNVGEWCQNRLYSYNSEPTDGSALENSEESLRVIRGGNWSSIPSEVRAAVRSRRWAAEHNERVGFRLALPVR